MGKKAKKKFKKRKGIKNKHHNVAKSRGGTGLSKNIVRLDENRHNAFHLLFGNRTFREASEVLLRADRMLVN